MRSLLLVCLLGSIASAETLPVDVVTKGSAGDWTIFDGVRRKDDKLIVERAVAMLSAAKIDSVYGSRVVIGTMRVEWHRGEQTKVAWWQEEKFTGSIEPRMFGVTTTVKNFKTAPATCKLDNSFPCTKVTFSGQSPDDPSKELTVMATMAEQVIGIGLVEIEVTDKDRVMLRYKVSGYGHWTGPKWGVSLQGIKIEKQGKPNPPVAQPTDVPPPMPDGPPPSTSLSIGLPTATGDLDKAIIRRYIKRNSQKLAYCYDKELLAKPTLQGTIVASFEIAEDGKVAAARAKGFDTTVAECVTTVIKAIEFPKPKGGKVTVTYPLGFAPPAGKKS